MSQQYFDDVLRITTASLLQGLGWNSATNQSIDTLNDVFGHYLQSICCHVKRYSEFAQQTDPKIDDVLAALSEMGICLPELEEYLSDVEPNAFPRDVVSVNVPKSNTLKFPTNNDEHSQNETDMGIEPWMPLQEVTKGSHSSVSGSLIGQEKRMNSDNRPSTPAQLKRHKSLLEDGGSKSEMQCVMMSPMGLVVTQGTGQTPSSMLPPTTVKKTKHKVKKAKVETVGADRSPLLVGKQKTKHWDDAASETDDEWQDIQDKKTKKKLKKAKLAEKKAKLKLDVDRKKALKKKKELKLRAKREEKLRKEQKKRNEEKYKAKLQAKKEAKLIKKLKKEKVSTKKKKAAQEELKVDRREKLFAEEAVVSEPKPKRKGRGRPPKAPKVIESIPSTPAVFSPPFPTIEDDDGDQTAGEEFHVKETAASFNMNSPPLIPSSPMPDTSMSPEVPTSPHDLVSVRSPERSFTEPPASPESTRESDEFHRTCALESHQPPSPQATTDGLADGERGSLRSATEIHRMSGPASPLSGPSSHLSGPASPKSVPASPLSGPASPDLSPTASPVYEANPEQRTVVPLRLKLDRLPSDEEMFNDREKKRKKKKKKERHKEKKKSREESPVMSSPVPQETTEPMVPRIKLTLGGHTSIVARADSEESVKRKKKKKKDKLKEDEGGHSNITSSGLKLVIKPIRSPSTSPSPQRRPVLQPFSPRSDGESSGSDATIPFAGTPRSSPAVSPIYNPSPSPPRRVISPKRPVSKNARKKATKKVAIETKTIDIVQENVQGDSAWTCPACHHGDDGGKMIGCDKCDKWYHWACVGITQEPEESEWYCPTCTKKVSGAKKRKKAKK